MKYSNPLKTVRDRIMESLPDGDTHARAVGARIGQLAEAVAGLERLAEHRSPSDTPEAHYKKIAAAAGKLGGKIESADKSIHDLAAEGTLRLDAAIIEVANLTPGENAPELRQAVREMKPDKRRDALKVAVDARDHEVVAALTSGHPLTTGLNKEFAARMRQAFIEQHAPAESQAQERLHSTFSTAVQALGTARAAVRQATDPTKLRQIEERAEAASKAQADFDGALSE